MYRDCEKFWCVIMRGGTSRAVFLMENELPKDPEFRNRIILAIFGSPDPRQIDGIAGADPLTSKLAVIGPASVPDADVDYTFGQVDIHSTFIDYGSNCGNISSAVGPFAIEQGLVRAVEPVTQVRIHNTNTRKILVAEIPVCDGKPVVKGDYRIAGVPRPGARLKIDFAGTAGSKTGRLLPTGNTKDVLDVPDVGRITVSLVDAASPMVFVRASDLSLTGTETPKEADGNPELLDRLEKIRAKAAERIGLVSRWQDALTVMRAVPLIAFVAPPRPYVNIASGDEIEAGSVDFVSRCMFMRVMHKTYSGTATVCTGAAAAIEGTVVNDVIKNRIRDGVVRFGHPGGVIEVEISVEKDREDGAFRLKRAAIGRTARRIMEGYVYVPRHYISG